MHTRGKRLHSRGIYKGEEVTHHGGEEVRGGRGAYKGEEVTGGGKVTGRERLARADDRGWDTGVKVRV